LNDVGRDWILEIVKTAIGGAVGVLIGAALMRRRTQRDQLFECYAHYFDAVIEVALKHDAISAQAALSALSRISHKLELLESDGACIVAAGMLVARCNVFVSALVGDEQEDEVADVGRLRHEISDEYWRVLETVRRRLGFDPASGARAPGRPASPPTDAVRQP
jgi:hypothetical protein